MRRRRFGSLCILALGAVAQPHVVRAQAETLTSAPAAGHDGGFFLGSEEFRLDISGFLQFRWDGVNREQDDAEDTGWNSGFEIRRARLTLDGELYDGAIGFTISNSFSRSGGEDSLSDGYVTFALPNDMSLRLGQFKLPFTREELTSAKRLLAVDRSMTNAVFSLRRSQGLEVSRETGRHSLALAISDGADNANTGAYDDGSDFAITGRAEYLAAGTFRQFRGFSGFPETERGLLLGGAGHAEWTSDEPGAPSEQIAMWTLDATWQGDGWSAFVAYIGKYDSAGDDGAAATDHGVVAQASRFVQETTEVFARYDAVIPDSSRQGDELFNCLTVGFNRYLHGHSAKFSADVQWFPDAADDNDLIGNEPGIGYLDSGSSHDEVVIRAQFQLLF